MSLPWGAECFQIVISDCFGGMLVNVSRDLLLPLNPVSKCKTSLLTGRGSGGSRV